MRRAKTVTLRLMERPPKELQHLVASGYKIFVAEFTPRESAETISAKIAGKKGRYYLVPRGMRGYFDVYDAKRRFEGTFHKTELFNAEKIRYVREYQFGKKKAKDEWYERVF